MRWGWETHLGPHRVVSAAYPQADTFPSKAPCLFTTHSPVWPHPCSKKTQMLVVQTQRYLATPHLSRWRDLLSMYPGSCLFGNDLARYGPQTEPAQEFFLTIARLLSLVLTNAREFKSLKGGPLLPLKQTGSISCCC